LKHRAGVTVRETKKDVKSAIAIGRKMLREAETQLNVVPKNKYRDALSSLVTTLDGMIGQFSV